MASELGRTLMETRTSQDSSTSAPEELLVFGYSCKLFRDNEKALYLDQGKHLIPWMGDSSLMVDRFDVRGALYDLKEAESGGGMDRWEGMSEEERVEEERCDCERYLALYHDEYQYEANQEEEAKRLVAELGSDNYAYSQVGFSYDQPMDVAHQNSSEEQATEEIPEEIQETPTEEDTGYFPLADEDTFFPPPELNVPAGMVVPETVKQNKIIVKTSKFIATQGGQMEILIKTKQAGNPMFSFLQFDHPLNAFYKHTVSMIKSGRYRPSHEGDQEKDTKESDLSEGQYLHPSLSAGIKPDLTPGTPSSLHKPSADCAYSKLIHKIQEKQKNTTVEGIESPGSPSVPVITSTPAVTAAAAAAVTAALTPVAPTSTPVAATSTPVAATSTPVTGTTDTLNRKKKKKTENADGSPKIKSLVDYPSFNITTENNSDDERRDDMGNDCEDDITDQMETVESSEYKNIKWPPPDVQMVIDKMASYIIKNGEAFEAMVSSRDDPRFSFLRKEHEYYPYYRCKMRLYSEVYGDIFKETCEEKSTTSGNDTGSSKTPSGGQLAKSAGGSGAKKDKRAACKQPSTICFSIKSREQEVNLDRHSTFPVESSSTEDEDMDEEERERRKIEREERRRKRKLKEKEDRERREREERERKEKLEKEKIIEKTEESTEASDDNADAYDIFKYAQEMGGEGEAENPHVNEKFSNGELKKYQNGQSEETSDNYVSGQPERKQQERRKKAAMFLSRLKKGSEDETTQPVYGPQLPPEIAAQLLNSDSQSPRSSSRSSRHSSSRSRSRSSSPKSGIPMPPADSPAPPPPPPPPVHSPIVSALYESEWGSNLEAPTTGDLDEEFKVSKQDSSVLSGASEEDCRSQSTEIRSSKSRHVEPSNREKARSRKKHHHDRSESRSPSSRRDRKKRKRSRSRSRRHKKRHSRSSSHSRSCGGKTHKKKRRKHSSRHERSERRSKKSRRSVSSSSDSSALSYSSRSSSPSESEIQVIESPNQSKRGSRASSIVSVYASDLSVLSSGLPKILEESPSAPATPPLPPVPCSPISTRLASVTQENLTGDRDGVAETGESEAEGKPKEEKKEEKKVFDPQRSAAMAKIAQGLRAKVHALLEKESKL